MPTNYQGDAMQKFLYSMAVGACTLCPQMAVSQETKPLGWPSFEMTQEATNQPVTCSAFSRTSDGTWYNNQPIIINVPETASEAKSGVFMPKGSYRIANTLTFRLGVPMNGVDLVVQLDALCRK
jgi:hypothetical protein